MPLTEAEALERLADMVAYDQEPTLSAPELKLLLNEAARAASWQASTAYAVGDRIVTPARNGRLYVCREPGTSAATEPDWGTSGEQFVGRRVTDGDDLVWEDAGPAFAELWDLRQAAQQGWLLKAAKAAGHYQFTAAGQTFHREQVHEHCLAMAGRFAPVFVG
ncbi:MAG TPA: hypothetical protein VFU47_03045 [Armatimonadota bacterium]|nr:hypothetical protein [Armatimonadota bacterium]